jgi:hypothetical protein
VEPLEAVTQSGDSVNGFSSHFMIDLDTYVHGASLGFEGADFYVAGRGGALGDVHADVVAASFVFFNPTTITEAWDRSTTVMSRQAAADAFIAVGHAWAEAKLPDDLDAARLAHLAGQIAAAASVGAVPLFAAWRTQPEPSADRPKALALHRLNLLRELRGGMHGAAVMAQGIDAHAAVAFRTPYMLPVFGWPEPHPERAEVKERWKVAQANTDAGLVPAYGALDAAERAEFVELANAAQAAVTAG